MKKLLKMQTLSIYIALLAIIALFSILSPTFLSVSNALTILRQISSLGIMAMGMMFVMLLGNVDLSVGTSVSLIGICMAYFMVNMHLSIGVTVLLGIAIGLVIGFLNGFVVTYCKIPSIIATLGTSWVFKGLSYTICNAQPIYGFPEGFAKLGQGSAGPIPIPVILFIICVLITSFVMNRTVYGRTLYAVGSNKEASRLSGTNVNFMNLSAYVICAAFATLAGIILLSRVNSGLYRHWPGDGCADFGRAGRHLLYRRRWQGVRLDCRRAADWRTGKRTGHDRGRRICTADDQRLNPSFCAQH